MANTQKPIKATLDNTDDSCKTQKPIVIQLDEIPTPEAGDAGKTLVVNAEETGYELASGGGGKYFTDLVYSTSVDKMVLTTAEYGDSDAAYAALVNIFNEYLGIEYTIDDDQSIFYGMIVRCNFTTCTNSKVDGLGYGTASVNKFLALMTGAIFASGDKYVIKYEVTPYELE